MSFTLPKINYPYNALEPYIDSKTMEIHHSKHHAGYTNNLNNAIIGTEFESQTIEDILQNPNLPVAIKNNGGGFFVPYIPYFCMFPEHYTILHHLDLCPAGCKLDQSANAWTQRM